MKQGWELKKLSEVGAIYNGNSINEKVKKEKYTGLEDGLPFIATKDVSFDSVIDYENGVLIPLGERLAFKIAPEGTVLICAEGGSAGRKIGLTNREVCFGNKLFAFKPGVGIYARYVYYYFFSSMFRKQFSSRMTGIIGGISMSKFKDITIPIPPLSEQHQIVDALDKALSKITEVQLNAEVNLQGSRELLKSYLHDVFDKDALDWTEKPLIDICDQERGITYGVIKLGLEHSDGVPCLRTSNVKWLNIDVKGIKRIARSLSSEYSRTVLRGGEVLVNVRGTLGGVAVVPPEMAGWNVSREVSVIPVKASVVIPAFLCYQIGSETCQKWLMDVKKGAAYTGINLEDLRLLTIKFPSIEKQMGMVKLLNSVYDKTIELEVNLHSKIDALLELRQVILNGAFDVGI